MNILDDKRGTKNLLVLESASMIFLEIIMIFLVFLSSFVAGFLKNYPSSKLIRFLITVVSPTFSCMLLLYITSDTLVEYFTNANLSLTLPLTEMILLSLFCVVWYVLYQLVNLGYKTGEKEQAGIHDENKSVTNKVKQELEHILIDFIPTIRDNISSDFEAKSALMQELIASIEEKLANISIHQQEWNKKLSIILESYQMFQIEQQRQKQTYEQYIDKLLSTSNLFEIFLFRIESVVFKRIDSKNNDKSFTETKFIAKNGIGKISLAQKRQEQFAQGLRNFGFGVTNRNTQEKSYYFLELNNKIVAIGFFKSFLLYDQPKRIQKHISKHDAHSALTLAKTLGLPVVLFVENRHNNRRWAYMITFDMIKDWEKISTSVLLAKNDDLYAQECEAEFLNVLDLLGIKT